MPIINAKLALGKREAARSLGQHGRALEEHLPKVPEDAERDANLALLLRPNEPSVLSNAACAFWLMQEEPAALDAIRKVWDGLYAVGSGAAS